MVRESLSLDKRFLSDILGIKLSIINFSKKKGSRTAFLILM
jgi:hypothetical protein